MTGTRSATGCARRRAPGGSRRRRGRTASRGAPRARRRRRSRDRCRARAYACGCGSASGDDLLGRSVGSGRRVAGRGPGRRSPASGPATSPPLKRLRSCKASVIARSQHAAQRPYLVEVSPPVACRAVTDVPEKFRALVADKDGDDVRRSLTELSAGDLPEGEVTVRVGWSSVNYKDALAVSPEGRVAKGYPLVPGIDLAGEVIASDGGDVSAGDQVVVHGYDLGVGHHGGYAEIARVPADWVVRLPDGLSARDAMALGTAGFTAALSVVRLEQHGLSADSAKGSVLVLGASGGVGSIAVGILAARGYEVHAATGKAEEADFLRALGASEILSREETSGEAQGPLDKQRWAGVVDPVGGAATAFALRTTRYGGAVASSGLTGGTDLQTTIFPFILRAVSLLGVDSVATPMAERREVWNRLAGDLRPNGLEDQITREIALDEVDPLLDEVLAGRARGRTVVRVGG